MLRLGEQAPDFTAQSNEGELRFHDWLGGRWGVLFSYPKAFTSICGSELVDVARLRDSFSDSGIKVAALSLDTSEDQQKFGEELAASESCPTDKLTQISDPERKVADLYGMVHPEAIENLAIRTTYVIDPDRRVRMLQAYPPKVRRDFKALLEGVQMLQATDGGK